MYISKGHLVGQYGRKMTSDQLSFSVLLSSPLILINVYLPYYNRGEEMEEGLHGDEDNNNNYYNYYYCEVTEPVPMIVG